MARAMARAMALVSDRLLAPGERNVILPRTRLQGGGEAVTMGEIDLVIRGARLVTPTGLVEGDLAIVGDTIAAVGQPITQARHEIDASGRLVLPGGVDAHAHIEQMSGMGNGTPTPLRRPRSLRRWAARQA